MEHFFKGCVRLGEISSTLHGLASVEIHLYIKPCLLIGLYPGSAGAGPPAGEASAGPRTAVGQGAPPDASVGCPSHAPASSRLPRPRMSTPTATNNSTGLVSQAKCSPDHPSRRLTHSLGHILWLQCSGAPPESKQCSPPHPCPCHRPQMKVVMSALGSNFCSVHSAVRVTPPLHEIQRPSSDLD